MGRFIEFELEMILKSSSDILLQVSRHGNRGLKDYPLDPYPIDDPKYWPYGSKQLTPVSITRLFCHNTYCQIIILRYKSNSS